MHKCPFFSVEGKQKDLIVVPIVVQVKTSGSHINSLIVENLKLFNIGTWYKSTEKKRVLKERNETTKNKKRVRKGTKRISAAVVPGWGGLDNGDGDEEW